MLVFPPFRTLDIGLLSYKNKVFNEASLTFISLTLPLTFATQKASKKMNRAIHPGNRSRRGVCVVGQFQKVQSISGMPSLGSSRK